MTEGTHLYGDRAPHNEQFVVLSASSNLTLERVLTGTANQIVVTDNGAGSTVVLSLSSTLLVPGVITVPNTGLHILDTNASHDLIIAPGSDLTADRTLTLTTGDAARTITLSGNPTLNDWFDQAVKAASTPTFGGIVIADGGTVGQAAGPLITFDDSNNFLEIMGCSVGVGIASPDGKFHIWSASAGAIAADGSADELVLENSGNAGLTILAGNANNSRIYFGDDGSATVGRFNYSHANERILIGAAGANILRIEAGLVSPDATSYNLGDGTKYWNDVSYKTLTDRGCLGWYDEGVELQDGKVENGIKAIRSAQKHPTLKTIAGAPRLDYSTLPKHVYKPVPIAKEDIYEYEETDDDSEPKEVLLYKKGEKMGEDGAELTALVSIMLSAIKELDDRLATLEQ